MGASPPESVPTAAPVPQFALRTNLPAVTGTKLASPASLITAPATTGAWPVQVFPPLLIYVPPACTFKQAVLVPANREFTALTMPGEPMKIPFRFAAKEKRRFVRRADPWLFAPLLLELPPMMDSPTEPQKPPVSTPTTLLPAPAWPK